MWLSSTAAFLKIKDITLTDTTLGPMPGPLFPVATMDP
jgi:hypothetical protein